MLQYHFLKRNDFRNYSQPGVGKKIVFEHCYGDNGIMYDMFLSKYLKFFLQSAHKYIIISIIDVAITLLLLLFTM